MRERRLSEDELFQTLLRQEAEGRPLGSILVEAGTLTEEELRDILECKAEETIYDLFLWPDGEFEFKEGAVPAGVGATIDLEVGAVVFEGVRRLDEWARIREVLPSPGVAFKAAPVPPGLTDPGERQTLELAAAGKTLTEISLAMRRSEFDTAALLFELHRRGLVAVDRVVKAPRVEDPVGTIKELLTVAGRHFTEKNYEAAIEAYEQALALDRLNQQAKKGLVAAFDARARQRAVRSVPLRGVPVVRMGMSDLTREDFDPQEGFVLSRINGEWDVASILKLCPLGEEDVLVILAHLLQRGVIGMRSAGGGA